ncbi:hypothetical protein AaE_003418 [Aphanomyces astaci]|uniref:Uncharacterized protein n=1 Tax=Aphanomyces astaci TaxID=112090 RepID=A0A6A5AVH3_APHAT|nr:hypothetical protein AaE_003418 [Aphanomyces astaci]
MDFLPRHLSFGYPLVETLKSKRLPFQCYFGSWGWSVAHTSLLDSLLLVCTSPLLMVGIMTLRWFYRRLQARHAAPPLPNVVKMQPRVATKQSHCWTKATTTRRGLKQWCALPPTWLEVVGAAVGFAGVVALLSTATDQGSTSHDVTLVGNASALLGALVIVVYFEGCSTCRKWMPLFLYMLSITTIAAVDLAVASLLFEPHTTVSGLGPDSLFGLLGDLKQFGLPLVPPSS